jgi:hypothetical protein
MTTTSRFARNARLLTLWNLVVVQDRLIQIDL